MFSSPVHAVEDEVNGGSGVCAGGKAVVCKSRPVESVKLENIFYCATSLDFSILSAFSEYLCTKYSVASFFLFVNLCAG